MCCSRNCEGVRAATRGQKIHLSARNYTWNLERTSIHITPLCSLLHTLLKDKCVCLQDSQVKIVIEIFCPLAATHYNMRAWQTLIWKRKFYHHCYIPSFLAHRYPGSCGILGQVWYLIVSIPDLCPLSYLNGNEALCSCVFMGIKPGAVIDQRSAALWHVK